MNIEVGNPHLYWLFASVPVILVALITATWLTQRTRRSFGQPSRFGIASLCSSLALILGIVLLAIACLDLRWGKSTREVPQKGLEIVFALDVSRSMLAEDAKPNRLSRAKQQIKDMISQMAGDRIGLVAFAGEAKQAVPLTNHYEDFRQTLDSLGPDSVEVGGSQLGVALQAAADSFLAKTNDHRTVVLFTDGEDQESKPVELAKRMHTEMGLRVFTVGLGDMDQGARIPVGDDNSRFVRHNGEQVWSRQNGSVLRQIATETNAAYIPAGTKRVNMIDVYHNYIANIEKTDFQTAKINAMEARFQWFAFPAFLCMFAHLMIATRKPKDSEPRQHSNRASKRQKSTRPTQGRRSAPKVAAAFLVLAPSIALAQANPESEIQHINSANDLIRSENYDAAIELLNKTSFPDKKLTDRRNYALASAFYRKSNFEAAIESFEKSAGSSDRLIAGDSRYNLGNCYYALAIAVAEENPEAAISSLEQAIVHYRSALRLDRSRTDARQNLERAKRLMDQLRKKDEEQEQPEQEQQDQQDDSDQEEQDSEQKSSDNSDEPGSSETDTDQQQQDQSSDSQQEQDRQSSENTPTESNPTDDAQPNSQGSSQDPESSNESNSTEPGDPGDQADQTQDSPQQDEDGPDEPSSQQSNSQPADQEPDKDGDPASQGEERDANEPDKEPPRGQLSSDNQPAGETDTEANAAQSSGSTKDVPGMMTRQEAMKLLQAIRDRDMLRRLRQQMQRRQRRVQVEKDW